jgi:hypothetical protein
MSERPGYDEFLKNVKRVRLTRAGLLKIMRENERREAEKATEQQSPDAAQSSGTSSGGDAQ